MQIYRVGVWFLCTVLHCHLSINQVPFKSLLYSKKLPRQTLIMKKMVMGRLHCKYTG